MRLQAVICEVLFRESCQAAARSKHVLDLSFQPFGLHNTPDELRSALQREIDSASGGSYDFILLAYGLCSRGTADLVARDTPIVIPRAHDCITLLLGSKERYREQFQEHPGTYYYSPGWIEHKEGDVKQGSVELLMEQSARERFDEYVRKYGEDNARYLLEQESLWQVNYDRTAFIDTGLGDMEYYRRFTKGLAEKNGWSYEEMPGDTRLIDLLFRGEWDPEEFLIAHPGQRTIEAVNSEIISTCGESQP